MHRFPDGIQAQDFKRLDVDRTDAALQQLGHRLVQPPVEHQQNGNSQRQQDGGPGAIQPRLQQRVGFARLPEIVNGALNTQQVQRRKTVARGLLKLSVRVGDKHQGVPACPDYRAVLYDLGSQVAAGKRGLGRHALDSFPDGLGALLSWKRGQPAHLEQHLAIDLDRGGFKRYFKRRGRSRTPIIRRRAKRSHHHQQQQRGKDGDLNGSSHGVLSCRYRCIRAPVGGDSLGRHDSRPSDSSNSILALSTRKFS
ncbi:hypothetical protein D3C72_1254270 [compost metagenome]